MCGTGRVPVMTKHSIFRNRMWSFGQKPKAPRFRLASDRTSQTPTWAFPSIGRTQRQNARSTVALSCIRPISIQRKNTWVSERPIKANRPLSGRCPASLSGPIRPRAVGASRIIVATDLAKRRWGASGRDPGRGTCHMEGNKPLVTMKGRKNTKTANKDQAGRPYNIKIEKGLRQKAKAKPDVEDNGQNTTR